MAWTLRSLVPPGGFLTLLTVWFTHQGAPEGVHTVRETGLWASCPHTSQRQQSQVWCHLAPLFSLPERAEGANHPSLGQSARQGKFLPDPGRDHQLHSGHVTKIHPIKHLHIGCLCKASLRRTGCEGVNHGKRGLGGPSLIPPSGPSCWEE